MKQSLTTNHQAFVVFGLISLTLILQAAGQRQPSDRRCVVCNHGDDNCYCGRRGLVSCEADEYYCVVVHVFISGVFDCCNFKPRFSIARYMHMVMAASVGIYRRCSNRNINGCVSQNFPDGSKMLTCYTSCTYHGCNGSPPVAR